MKSILKGPVFKGDGVVEIYNQDFARAEFSEQIQYIDRNGIKAKIRQIAMDGLDVAIREVVCNHTYSVDVEHDFPLFKIHFEIEGSNSYLPLNERGVPVYIPGGHYNLFYIPEVHGVLKYETQRRKTLEIKFSEALIKKVMGLDYLSSLTDFYEAIKQKKSFLLWKHSRPISLDLQQIIQDIIDCKFEGGVRRAYLQTKIMELLVIVFAKVEDKLKNNVHHEVPEAECEQLRQVEEYMKANLSKSVTISELATVAGMNSSKFKYSFKEVYSSTVFKYMTELRMKEAVHLIKEKNYTISQASSEVGYKNPQHFTVAFKKLYGVLPRDILKS